MNGIAASNAGSIFSFAKELTLFSKVVVQILHSHLNGAGVLILCKNAPQNISKQNLIH